MYSIPMTRDITRFIHSVDKSRISSWQNGHIWRHALCHLLITAELQRDVL